MNTDIGYPLHCQYSNHLLLNIDIIQFMSSNPLLVSMISTCNFMRLNHSRHNLGIFTTAVGLTLDMNETLI